MWSKQRPQFAHSAQIHRRQNYNYMPMKSGLSFAYVLSFVCICINCITGIVFKCCYILGLVLRTVIRATQCCLTVLPYCVLCHYLYSCLYCRQIYMTWLIKYYLIRLIWTTSATPLCSPESDVCHTLSISETVRRRNSVIFRRTTVFETWPFVGTYGFRAVTDAFLGLLVQFATSLKQRTVFLYHRLCVCVICILCE